MRIARPVFVGAVLLAATPAAPSGAAVADLLGTWRGTSICTDRAAAPACQDETVVYEFTAGSRLGSVLWKADKVVNGERQSMGEMELTYDTNERCWKGEFESPRIRSVWCLAASGDHITGTGRLLPGRQTIRRTDVRKEPPRP